MTGKKRTIHISYFFTYPCMWNSVSCYRGLNDKWTQTYYKDTCICLSFSISRLNCSSLVLARSFSNSRCLSISRSSSLVLSLHDTRAITTRPKLMIKPNEARKTSNRNPSSSWRSSISLKAASSKHFLRACLIKSFFCLRATISSRSLDLSLAKQDNLVKNCLWFKVIFTTDVQSSINNLKQWLNHKTLGQDLLWTKQVRHLKRKKRKDQTLHSYPKPTKHVKLT